MQSRVICQKHTHYDNTNDVQIVQQSIESVKKDETPYFSLNAEYNLHVSIQPTDFISQLDIVNNWVIFDNNNIK